MLDQIVPVISTKENHEIMIARLKSSIEKVKEEGGDALPEATRSEILRLWNNNLIILEKELEDLSKL